MEHLAIFIILLTFLCVLSHTAEKLSLLERNTNIAMSATIVTFVSLILHFYLFTSKQDLYHKRQLHSQLYLLLRLSENDCYIVI